MTNAQSVILLDASEYEATTQNVDDFPDTVPIPDSFEEEVVETSSSAESSNSSRECVICYDSLSSTKNLCITECGHEFCFSCIMKHVQLNNGCPCCRAVIIESIENSDDEEEEEYEDDEEDSENSDDDEEEEDEEDEEEEEMYPVEKLEEAFIAKGYTLKDALSLLTYNFSKTDEKYTKEFIKQLEDDVDEMVEELEREHEEIENMAEAEEESGSINPGTEQKA